MRPHQIVQVQIVNYINEKEQKRPLYDPEKVIYSLIYTNFVHLK